MKSLTAIIAPPLLCAGVLLGITVEKFGHVRPQDAEAYHARVKAAIEKMNFTIGDERSGIWIGKHIEPTQAAVKLLRPNIILSRRYSDNAGGGRFPSRHCSVLIVHCKDSRDMVGHYPENCYVNIGETLVEKRGREWQVGGMFIIGTEYIFERLDRSRVGAQRARQCVYNFLVVPTNEGMVIVRDIKGLNEAAEDYQKRYFGAAQFQFVMDADKLSREERDQIFETLLGSNLQIFEALNSLEVR